MAYSSEQIQIFYEFAMSIGTSLDLDTMLRKSLSTILRKLNCSVGSVHFYKQDKEGKFSFEQVFSIPRDTDRIKEYSKVMKQVPFQIYQDELFDFNEKLPLSGTTSKGKFFHIFELPGLGFVILLKSNADIEPLIIKSMKAIFVKLARACTACLQNEEIKNEIQERKSAEDKLSQSQEQLQAIMDNTTSVIYLKDTEGRYILVNNQFEKLFGVRSNELVGKTDHDIFPVEMADNFQENDKKVIESSVPLEVEESAPHDDGVHTYISVKFPMYDSNKKIYGVCGISTDITDRKNAEAMLKSSHDELEEQVRQRTADLKKSEESYRSIFNNSNDAIFIHDIETGKILNVNERMLSMFDYENKKEVIDSFVGNLSSGITPFTEEEAGEFVGKALEGDSQVFDWHSKEKNGRLFWTEVHLKRVSFRGEDRLLAFVRDTDQQKKAEELLKNVISTIPNQVFWKDSDLKYMGCNRKFAEVVGLEDPGEIIGKTDFDFNRDPKHAGKYVEWDKKIMKTGEAVIDLEEKFHNSDGDEGYVLTSKAPLVSAKGEVFGVLGVCTDITDQKLIEEKLRNQENMLSQIIEAWTSSIWYLDTEGRVIYLNDAARKVTSLEHEEITGKTVMELIPGEESKLKHFQSLEVMRTGKPILNIIESFIGPDEKTYWVTTDKVPHFDENHKVQGIFIFTTDITPVKEVERKLKESESRLADAQRIAHLGSWEFDVINQEIKWSDETFRIWGHEPQASAPPFDQYIESVHPDDRQLLLDSLEKATQGVPYQIELRHLLPDETYNQTLTRCQPVIIDGKVTKLLGSVLDIADRKKAEQELIESEERYRALFTNEIDAISIFDLETMNYIDVNDAFLKLYGYTRDEILSSKVDVVSAEPVKTQKAVKESKEKGNLMVRERLHKKKDGTTFFVEISAGPFIWKGQNLMYALIRDITVRKNAELAMKEALERLKATQSQLIQSEKMAGLGTLVAGLAHEINNPVNYVHTNAYSLIKEIKDFENYVSSIIESENEENREIGEEFTKRFEKCSDMLIDIEDGSKRIKTIINDLRRFSIVEEQRMGESKIVEGLQSTARIVKAQFKESISFKENYSADPLLKCIPAQINQVFMNVLTNACQSVEEKIVLHRKVQEKSGQADINSTIEINTMEKKGNLIIEVIDHGFGMDEETQKKIFDPFFTTKEPGKGMGMGLAISFGIIEKHKGKIEVESEKEKGTIFRIVLPGVKDEHD